MFGARFEHTFFKDIIGDKVRISGKIVKIHPRSHVDGYDIIQVIIWYLKINPIGLFIVPIGFTISLYGLSGIYSYKFKPEKYTKALEKSKITDDKIKRNYYKFLVMVIIIPIVVFLFLSPLTFFIFGGLGLFILLIGSIIIFGIFGYNLRKMTNRYKGIIEIINGIVILSIGLGWIYLFLILTAYGWYFYEIFYLIFGSIFILIGLVITPKGIIVLLRLK